MKTMIWIIACCSFSMAAYAQGTNQANISMSEGWSVRSKSNFKSATDSNTYKADTELLLRKKITSRFTAVIATQISQKGTSRDNKDHWDELTFGAKTKFNLEQKKHSAKVFYHYHPEQKKRISSRSNSYLEGEIKATYGFGGLKMTTKYKAYSYVLRSRKVGATETRFKIEAFPGLYTGAMQYGLYNAVDHKMKILSKASTNYEIGPYIRYKGKHFRPRLIVSYNPFSSDDRGYLVEKWSSKPTVEFRWDMVF